MDQDDDVGIAPLQKPLRLSRRKNTEVEISDEVLPFDPREAVSVDASSSGAEEEEHANSGNPTRSISTENLSIFAQHFPPRTLLNPGLRSRSELIKPILQENYTDSLLESGPSTSSNPSDSEEHDAPMPHIIPKHKQALTSEIRSISWTEGAIISEAIISKHARRKEIAPSRFAVPQTGKTFGRNQASKFLKKDLSVTNIGFGQLEKLFFTFLVFSEKNGWRINKDEFLEVLKIPPGGYADELWGSVSPFVNIAFDQLILKLASFNKDGSHEEKVKFLQRLETTHSERWRGYSTSVTKQQLLDMLEFDVQENNIKLGKSKVTTLAENIFKSSTLELDGRLNLADFIVKNGVDPQNLTISLNASYSLLDGTQSHKFLPQDTNSVAKEAYENLIQKHRIQHVSSAGFLCVEDQTVDAGETVSNEVRGDSFKRWLSRSRKKILQNKHTAVWALVYLLCNIILFLIPVLYLPKDYRTYFGVPLVIGHGTGWMLSFNCTLIVIIMCNTILSHFRKVRVLFRYFPFDQTIDIHKFIGLVILVLSLIHSGVYYKVLYQVSTGSESELENAMKENQHGKPFTTLLFGSIPGLSGHIILAILLLALLFSVEGVRRQQFQAFFLIHHSLVLFYAGLIVHGFGRFWSNPSFPYWMIPAVLMLIVEIIVRSFRKKSTCQLISACQKADTVLQLTVTKPDSFQYQAGQFVYLSSPQLSGFELHPFTLTSAPFQNFLEFHIRGVGAWTKALYEAFDQHSTKKITTFHVYGPYGTPFECTEETKTVVLFGAGVGITPFASILKEIKQKQNEKQLHLNRVYIIWASKRQKQFSWLTETLKGNHASEVVLKDTEIETQSFLFDINCYVTAPMKLFDVEKFLSKGSLSWNYSAKDDCLVTANGTKMHFSRPKIGPLLQSIAESCDLGNSMV